MRSRSLAQIAWVMTMLLGSSGLTFMAASSEGAHAAPQNGSRTAASNIDSSNAPGNAEQDVIWKGLAKLDDDDPKDDSSLSDKIRARFAEELARCADERCRSSLRQEQSRRLAFANGRKIRMANLPWASGLFRSRQGGVQILPLGNKEIAVWIATSGNSGQWICDVAATGRLLADGTAVMTVHDRFAQGPERFLLRSKDGRQISILPASAIGTDATRAGRGGNAEARPERLFGACGLNGSIGGDYRTP